MIATHTHIPAEVLKRSSPAFENIIGSPLHILAARVLARVCGTFKMKSYLNVLPRGAYAYGLLRGAQFAQLLGITKATAVEFGVARGSGLNLLCRYRDKVEQLYGIEIDVVGVDTGSGLPSSELWEDHPELWREGDYATDPIKLEQQFSKRAQLIFGDVREMETLNITSPVIFASLDVDYYSSTLAALRLFKAHAAQFCSVYFDDIAHPTASTFRGQLLAISEFNSESEDFYLTRDPLVPGGRAVRNARWYDHMYFLEHRLNSWTQACSSRLREGNQRACLSA